jgi:hypothetical protein
MKKQRADPGISNGRPKKGKHQSKCTAGLDVAHLIRSIQRLEGITDCFGKAISDCSRTCPWRAYCLTLADNRSAVKKDASRAGDDYRLKVGKRKTQR